MNYNTIILALLVTLVSCKTPEARRPKKHGVTNFYKEMIEQNKKMNALETSKIENYVALDTLNTYFKSSQGFWYAYKTKDTLSSSTTAKSGDVVKINYDISTLGGLALYGAVEHEFSIDKEEFIPGLKDGIKLMKKGETMVFLIPSFRAYGVTGNGDKIKMNQTLKSTLTLINIKHKTNENN